MSYCNETPSLVHLKQFTWLQALSEVVIAKKFFPAVPVNPVIFFPPSTWELEEPFQGSKAALERCGDERVPENKMLIRHGPEWCYFWLLKGDSTWGWEKKREARYNEEKRQMKISDGGESTVMVTYAWSPGRMFFRLQRQRKWVFKSISRAILIISTTD